MATATLTSKGQVTIPVAVREALGLGAGDRLEFVEVEKGRFELVPGKQSVKALKGLIKKPSKPVSVASMNEAIKQQGSKAR